MNAHITITRLCLHGRHGLLPQERTVGANFFYTLRAEVDIPEEALMADTLEGSVCYAALAEVLKAENARPAATLEHLAYRTLKALQEQFPTLKSATLRIEKENPPMGVMAESVGVEFSLSCEC